MDLLQKKRPFDWFPYQRQEFYRRDHTLCYDQYIRVPAVNGGLAIHRVLYPHCSLYFLLILQCIASHCVHRSIHGT